MPSRKPRYLYPNAAKHDPDPAKLRALLEQASLTQVEAAKRLGVPIRTFKRYLSDDSLRTGLLAPYLVQFGLERLVAQRAHLQQRKAIKVGGVT